jgi:hypothetical protein
LKREGFETRGLRIETSRDCNGRFYLAYRPHVSQFFRDRKALTRWLGYPTQTPTRASLMSWLDSLEAADAQRKGAPEEAPVGDANVEGSFDPLAHDVDNSNTKMIT